MDIDTILQIGMGVVAGAGAMLLGFIVGVRKIGQAIPGDDKVEEFSKKLDEKVLPHVERILDLVRADTGKGVGTPSE